MKRILNWLTTPTTLSLADRLHCRREGKRLQESQVYLVVDDESGYCMLVDLPNGVLDDK